MTDVMQCMNLYVDVHFTGQSSLGCNGLVQACTINVI